MTTVDTTPAARRAFRKRLMARVAERRPSAVARPAPPNGATLAYTKILRDASRAMDEQIMTELRARGLARRDAVKELDPAPDFDTSAVVKAIQRRLAAVAGYQSLAGAIDKMASRLVEYSRTQWRSQLKSAIGIDLTADPNTAPMVERFRKRQGDLIVSLARDKVSRVRRVLREQGSDARVEDIQARIVEETGATESRAALIARTETTTFNAQLSQARHTAAGITEFTWSTSQDERVRESHRELDGKRFEYAKPPVVDGAPLLPGQFCNCRCTAIAIIPGVDD